MHLKKKKKNERKKTRKRRMNREKTTKRNGKKYKDMKPVGSQFFCLRSLYNSPRVFSQMYYLLFSYNPIFTNVLTYHDVVLIKPSLSIILAIKMELTNINVLVVRIVFFLYPFALTWVRLDLLVWPGLSNTEAPSLN